MRFAFFINVTSTHTVIDLFDAATMQDDDSKLASLVFDIGKNGPEFAGLNLGHVPGKADKLTIKKLCRLTDVCASEAAEHKLKNGYSPLLVARALLATESVQVAYDTTLGKYRCVTTMKEGLNAYELVGLPGMAVEAKDEEQAVRLAKKEVTDAMQANPESASKLVAFFSGGCKVKELKSGKLPTFTAVSALAHGKDEDKLAALPIKVAHGKDEE